jgi:hypothetical protein
MTPPRLDPIRCSCCLAPRRCRCSKDCRWQHPFVRRCWRGRSCFQLSRTPRLNRCALHPRLLRTSPGWMSHTPSRIVRKQFRARHWPRRCPRTLCGGRPLVVLGVGCRTHTCPGSKGHTRSGTGCNTARTGPDLSSPIWWIWCSRQS